MRYQQPFGVSDPNAPYIDGRPDQGIQGSIPPAAAFEQPQREIVGLIEKSFQAPSDLNLLQLTHGVRSQRLNYALDTGTQNNLTVAYDPPITQYHPGLTLHVRVRFTNTIGQVSIDAGDGRVPIRKMNNADVGDSELPVGSIATLIFDGTAFQLSNFGGAGGDTNVTQVNVPYAEDTSPTPGTIEVSFPLMPLPLVAGNILAVRVANTSPGATVMDINGGAAEYELLPNGGGVMLQGDILADDVVQFFYDGAFLRFIPNPEISAPVTYMVGPAQQFPNINAAFDALKRKIIGQSGYVTLQFIEGVFDGQINVAHPSGDRITVKGTMITAPPPQSLFAANGSSAAQRAADANTNIAMLRTRYGTEIVIPNITTGSYGVVNTGAGRITFADLLITGQQIPVGPNGEFYQNGVVVPAGVAARCDNVAVWGSQIGYSSAGALSATRCFAVANTNAGFNSGGLMNTSNGGAFGNTGTGYFTLFGSTALRYDLVRCNGQVGVWSGSGSSTEVAWCNTTTNGQASIDMGPMDLFAQDASTIGIGTVASNPAIYGPTSPAVGTTGNLASTISLYTKLTG